MGVSAFLLKAIRERTWWPHFPSTYPTLVNILHLWLAVYFTTEIYTESINVYNYWLTGIIWKIQKHRVTERALRSLCWFDSQMTITARTGPGQHCELGAQSGCLSWMAGTQPPEPSQLPPTVCLGRKLESRMEPEFKTSNMGCRCRKWILVIRLNACPRMNAFLQINI